MLQRAASDYQMLISSGYSLPVVSPEQRHPQNAGSASDESVSCYKTFVGKIGANLAA